MLGGLKEGKGSEEHLSLTRGDYAEKQVRAETPRVRLGAATHQTAAPRAEAAFWGLAGATWAEA